MQHVKTYFCSYSQCWSSPSNFATSWDNLASVSRMQGQNSSAISSTMKGTKNLVKTFSYYIQRRAVSKFYSSLVRILFHHSSWQRLTIHFLKTPCKKNKREDRTGIGQQCLNSVCVKIYLIGLCHHHHFHHLYHWPLILNLYPLPLNDYPLPHSLNSLRHNPTRSGIRFNHKLRS